MKSPKLRPLSEIMKDVNNVRFVGGHDTEDPLEFSSGTSSMLEEIKNLMDNAEASDV